MTEPADFNYYETNSAYGALFFQFPKVLMYGEQYKHLSSDAKLVYIVLKDRLEYSLHNHWVDGGGHVYFIFTNQELENLFNCRSQKVAELKKEFETAYLLMQKRMGFSPKTKKNGPSCLYLSKLGVKATDVCLCGGYAQKEPQAFATSGGVRITLPQETVRTLATSGNVKVTLPHKPADGTDQTLVTSGNVKVIHDLDRKQVLDTNRYNINAQKSDLSTTNLSPAEVEQQSRDLVRHVNDFSTNEDSGLPAFLEPEAVQLLSLWCRTPQQTQRFAGTILNTKHKVEKDHRDIGIYIPLDDGELRPLMTKTLRRCFNALRGNEEHIKDVENHLYGTMRNLFGTWQSKQAAREYVIKHPKERGADSEGFWDPNVFQK